MKRWFKNQNKTVCALENVSHTSSHVLKMADKINEKLLFPLIILQAQETVKDLETCCFYPWCSPGLYSRTPAASDTFHRAIPAGVTVFVVLQSKWRYNQMLHARNCEEFSKAADSTQHNIFWHSYSTSMTSFSFWDITNTFFCVSFEFSKNINNSGIRNQTKTN